jgi:hypothetical protein
MYKIATIRQLQMNPGTTTTGAGCFAEGPRLSAKPLRPSAKPLPGKARKKTWKFFFQSGEGPSGQRPLVSVEVASRGIFRAKFAATRSAGFELVTSHSRDTSSATCTTHSHASICRFSYSNIILNQVKIDCLRP